MLRLTDFKLFAGCQDLSIGDDRRREAELEAVGWNDMTQMKGVKPHTFSGCLRVCVRVRYSGREAESGRETRREGV